MLSDVLQRNGKLTEKALKEFTPIVEKTIKEVKAI
jgi:hypothetical protein